MAFRGKMHDRVNGILSKSTFYQLSVTDIPFFKKIAVGILGSNIFQVLRIARICERIKIYYFA
ncbi:MAG: hypothetical protein SAMD01599839_15010 [Rectinema sp.]